MGTVTKRITSKGEVRYRALIQVRKQDVNFTESKTFSKKNLAEAWIKKREYEIELDPSILDGVDRSLSLLGVIDKYLEVHEDVAINKKNQLQFIKRFKFTKKSLVALKRTDYADFALQRRAGLPDFNILPCSPATALLDLQLIRNVLNYAVLLLDYPDAVVYELDQANKGLRNAKQIARSEIRGRLLSSDELKDLTLYLAKLWERPNTSMPVHLIMWLAIYTSRRKGELFSLKLSDYNADKGTWLVRDVKNPNGSKGNHKNFIVSHEAKQIIDELLKPDVRKKMMRLGGNSELLLPVDEGSTVRIFINASKILGISDLRWHDLRHEAATRLAEKGLTIPQIQQYTLHDSWSSLERYVNLNNIRDNHVEYNDLI